MKTKTVIEMEYDELEEIVNKHYGLSGRKYENRYSFVATEECGNDSSHTFSIPKVKPLDTYGREKIEELRRTGHSPYANYIIFQDLVNSGVLAPGEYLVEVCW